MSDELPPDLENALGEVGDEASDGIETGPPGEPSDEIEADPETESSSRIVSWATSIPDGSHREWDPTDVWDPEGGGTARLAFHLADAAGADGEGLPNGAGVVLSLVEIYVQLARQSGDSGDSSDGEAPDAEEVARDTAEGLV